MCAARKHKIEDDCCVFNEEWTDKYYFVIIGKKVVCLLCHKSMVVFKEYNLKTHNQTKHADFGQNFTSRERKQKCLELVDKLKKQQNVFTKQLTMQDALAKASFMVSYKLAKRNKPFSDHEFIKECMSNVAGIMCPEQKTKMDGFALSKRTVVRRVEKISDYLMSQLKDKSKEFLWYSFVLD